MNIFSRFRALLKKAWYKLSPTAHNFAYLKEQANEMDRLLQGTDILRRSDMLKILQQNRTQLQTDIAGILQQYGLVQKSDIQNIVWQCAELPQIAKEYILTHQMDTAALESNKELYNGYKWIETQYLPEFIFDRFPHGAIGAAMENVCKKHPECHAYVLTDFPNYDYPYPVIGIDEVLEKAQDKNAVFILLYHSDWNALKTVRYFIDHGLKFETPLQTVPMARYFHTNRHAYETLKDEQLDHPREHFCPVDFENIFQGLEVTRKLPGDYVEIGTYQGASARAALNYMRRAKIHRTAYFLDTYEGFTYEDAEKSSDAAWYGTHTETSLETVKEYLSAYDNARPIKTNIITNELPEEIKEIALCNIDVDIYDAVYAALKKVAPLIVKHGIIIAEDYGHTPWLIGAQYAVRKFLEETKGFMPLYFSSGQIMLIRVD